ncbi:MAG: DUF4406 domain-containing protein [Lachnospiraceae bacterium]|nr:DUF4406 domain-containing protein [Lachnospiraceae bacterium]
MKVYISGPITGTNDYMERFGKAQDYLEDNGWSVVNPALVNSNLPKDTSYEEYMKMSFVMLDMCEAVYFLKGWEDSPGASREHTYAQEKGKKLIFEDEKKREQMYGKLEIEEDTLVADKESFPINNIPNFCYLKLEPGCEELIQEIESALGFRLFTWQKSYIAYGNYRRIGKTTAHILRQLLYLESDPMDLSDNRRAAVYADCKMSPLLVEAYRRRVKEIYEKLTRRGIAIRTVFFSKEDRERYKDRIENT